MRHRFAKRTPKEVSISKSAQKLIEEYELDPSQIKGTGKNGNIGVKDVRKALKKINNAAIEKAAKEMESGEAGITMTADEFKEELGVDDPELQKTASEDAEA